MEWFSTCQADKPIIKLRNGTTAIDFLRFTFHANSIKHINHPCSAIRNAEMCQRTLPVGMEKNSPIKAVAFII